MKTKPITLFVTWGLLGLALALLVLLAAPTHAAPTAVLTVCPAGPPDCDYNVIQDAVDAANDGDVIKVATGVYTDVQGRPSPPGYVGPAVITQVVYISKTVALRGGYTAPGFANPPDPDANPTTLDAQGQGRVLFIAGNISPAIEGLRIASGDADGLTGGLPGDNYDTGGGVYVVTASVTLNNNRVFYNSAFQAGGVYLQNSTASLFANSVTTNTASLGGGLGIQESNVFLNGNTISDNISDYHGGGLYIIGGTMVLSASVITSNSAGSWGGGLYLDGTHFTASGNTISDNDSMKYGGGLSLISCNATLTGNSITNNLTPLYGGGLSSQLGSLILTGNSILDNVSGWFGGGVYFFGGNVALNENTISTNAAQIGGGFMAEYVDIELNENILSANVGSDDGGGAYLVSGSSTWNDNLIVSNSANQYGGGIRLWYHTATLERTIILSNTAAYGGGLSAQSSYPTLTTTIIADNHATIAGSGIYLVGSYSSSHLLHTTIAHNTGGDGSGLYANASVWLTNTILVSHTVGITVTAGNTATLEATLWGNDTDWAGEGTISTGTINLWGAPDFVDPDAGDYHIGPGSAAIDAGVDAGVTTDIDGEPRPLGLGFDLGADEYAGPRLVLRKSGYPNPVETGGVLTYTFHVTNAGTVSLTATISDALPPHVTPGGSLVWTPVPLLPGEGWTETVVVTVEMGYVGPLTNVVQASSEEGATGAYANIVAVLDVPIAGLAAANDSPTTLGLSATLTAAVTAGTNVAYTWAFGDGDTGAGAAVSHTYPAVGVYAAVVTASNSASQLTATTSVTITDVPIEGLTAINDSPTDLGVATVLTATVAAGSNVTYTWAFGDGNTGSGAVVSHTYPAVGVYSAVVTASNSVSQLTATTGVTITDAPIEGLTAGNDGPTELGTATALTATIAAGTHVTYTWAFGDDETDAGAVVSHTYPAIGVYAAVVTASNSVSQLTATTSVTITQSGFHVYLPLVLKNP